MRTKLLLADDSITIQKVVGIIFSSEEYELTIVDNGNAALVKARENKPDVLLVDAVMPGKTGYEVCEEVRLDPVLKDLPILLLTGAFEPFDENKARQCGADDFISKPFESQHLIDKVASLSELAGKRASAASAPAPAAAPFVHPPPETAVPAPPPPIAPLAPAAEAFVAQATGGDLEFLTLTEEAVPAAAPGTVPAAPEFELEVVEGTSDDDLWGAFNLEDLADVESDYVGESPFEVEVLAAGAERVEEPFVFAEEGTLPPETADGSFDFAPKWEPVAESEFFFEETAETAPLEIAPEEQFGVFEEEAAPVFETVQSEPVDFFFETSEPAVPGFSGMTPSFPSAEPEVELRFAPEEEYVPVFEPVTPAAAAPPPAAGQKPEPLFAPEEECLSAPETLAAAAAPLQAPAPAAPVSLSDDQMAALVSRISRDIIEKIAWEVVPDLAERIINEEIRKIKEGN